MAMPLPGVHSEGGMMVGPQMELGTELGLFGMVAITGPRTPRVDREFTSSSTTCTATTCRRSTLTGTLGLLQRLRLPGQHADLPRARRRSGALARGSARTEFHVFHVHGHRWRAADGSYLDAAVLGPWTTVTVEWTEDRGRWLYHCHVVDHMMGGMIGHYVVS
jgi:hypothetical protein